MLLDPQLHRYLQGLVVGLDPVERFRAAVGAPDDYQIEIMRTDPLLNPEDQFVTVLASRQTGKSTSIASIAYDDMTRGKTALLAAPAQRQSIELLRRVLDFKNSDPCPPRIIRQTQSEIETDRGGRIISIPATDNARGFTCDTLILDEAAYLHDDAIAALLPMRKATGRVLMMSTPKGRDGFFWDTWSSGRTRRVFARSVDIPRLASKVEYDRRFMSELRFKIEHLCEFAGAGLPLIPYDVLDKAVSFKEPALCLI